MREAPSLPITARCRKPAAEIRAFDPEGLEERGRCCRASPFCADAYEAMERRRRGSSAPGWNEFRVARPGSGSIACSVADADLSPHVYKPAEMAASGFFIHIAAGP